eukprot:TRINITY_DN18702_c0_g1_i1.p1 TRINITY_DN18702_c0_g1~~TRINITY_DN18702_c0_g1_i1.p1  ORF type:complete len:540 (-),score=52.85 TRINITY_DN18702_c0_g1_i1:425-2044(-)
MVTCASNGDRPSSCSRRAVRGRSRSVGGSGRRRRSRSKFGGEVIASSRGCSRSGGRGRSRSGGRRGNRGVDRGGDRASERTRRSRSRGGGGGSRPGDLDGNRASSKERRSSRSRGRGNNVSGLATSPSGCVAKTRRHGWDQENPMEEPVMLKPSMCIHFTMGLCTKGQACSGAHGVRELMPGGIKPKMCDFMHGTCPRGEICLFAHSPNELPAGYKSKLCSFFQQGPCPRRDFCTYAHGEQELHLFSPAPSLAVAKVVEGGPAVGGTGGFKTKLCINHPSCPRGSACTFAHGEEEIRARPSAPPKPPQPSQIHQAGKSAGNPPAPAVSGSSVGITGAVVVPPKPGCPIPAFVTNSPLAVGFQAAAAHAAATNASATSASSAGALVSTATQPSLANSVLQMAEFELISAPKCPQVLPELSEIATSMTASSLAVGPLVPSEQVAPLALAAPLTTALASTIPTALAALLAPSAPPAPPARPGMHTPPPPPPPPRHVPAVIFPPNIVTCAFGPDFAAGPKPTPWKPTVVQPPDWFNQPVRRNV